MSCYVHICSPLQVCPSVCPSGHFSSSFLWQSSTLGASPRKEEQASPGVIKKYHYAPILGGSIYGPKNSSKIRKSTRPMRPMRPKQLEDVGSPPTPADARGSAPGNKTLSADHDINNNNNNKQQQTTTTTTIIITTATITTATATATTTTTNTNNDPLPEDFRRHVRHFFCSQLRFSRISEGTLGTFFAAILGPYRHEIKWCFAVSDLFRKRCLINNNNNNNNNNNKQQTTNNKQQTTNNKQQQQQQQQQQHRHHHHQQQQLQLQLLQLHLQLHYTTLITPQHPTTTNATTTTTTPNYTTLHYTEYIALHYNYSCSCNCNYNYNYHYIPVHYTTLHILH